MIKQIYYKILKYYRKRLIKNRQITIISNNCWGDLCTNHVDYNITPH